MEMADQEGADRVLSSPETEFECSLKQMSLSNKSHDIVNKNGIIDKHIERTLDEVLSHTDEQLSKCSSNARYRGEDKHPSLQPKCVEKNIVYCSSSCRNDVCKSAFVDDVKLMSKETACLDSSQNSKDMLVEQRESSSNEISKNIESDSGIISKLVVKDNGLDLEIVFVQYKSEDQLPDLVALITVDLSEPYSVYTYRYFLHNWPHLSHLAYHDSQCVGAIVCKLDIHRKNVLRGYIAMLVVHKSYRRWKIGSSLVRKAVKKMIDHGCEEVVLETEVTNKAALRLYENLGFVRDKRLLRYYLNGVDAWRLKLWLK